MNRHSCKIPARQDLIKNLRDSSYQCKYHQKNKSSLSVLVPTNSKNHFGKQRQQIFRIGLQVRQRHLELLRRHVQNELQEGITIHLLCVQKGYESETEEVNINLFTISIVHLESTCVCRGKDSRFCLMRIVSLIILVVRTFEKKSLRN